MQLSQEIGLIPEEPNYVNPFRAAAKVGGRREKRGGRREGEMEEYIEKPVDEQQVCERRGSGKGRVKGATWRAGGEGALDKSKRIHMTFNTCRNDRKQLVKRSRREPKRTRGHPKDQN